MRLAEIVITNMGHIMVSLRSWIGKRVVVAALHVSDRAEIVQVEEVRIDKARINWACIVVGSCRFTLSLGITVLMGVPVRMGAPVCTAAPVHIGSPVRMGIPVQMVISVPVHVPTFVVMRSVGLCKVIKSAAQCKQHKGELSSE